MAQYIPKDALVAEIEKVIDEPAPSHDQQCPWEDGYYCGLYKAENIIEKLEVKEVDFDALGILAEHLIACEAHGVAPKYRDREIDMLEKLKNNNAQKGE